ncbi:MAG: hypothetical protein WCD83_16780, partial [Pseudolabrys sp.]
PNGVSSSITRDGALIKDERNVAPILFLTGGLLAQRRIGTNKFTANLLVTSPRDRLSGHVRKSPFAPP